MRPCVGISRRRWRKLWRACVRATSARRANGRRPRSWSFWPSAQREEDSMTTDTDKFRLLHTMLRVKDLDAALDFYTNKLGMQLLRKTDFPSGEFTLAFVGYGDEENHTVIELTHNWGEHEYDIGTA